MPRSLPNEVRRAIVAAGAVALIVAATASTPVAIPSVDARALSARIAELERRIVQLETERSDAHRVTASVPATVKAPFIVLDSANNVLLRVDRSPATRNPRLTVGDTSGSSAVLVSTKEGGALQLFDAESKIRLTALASKTRTSVSTFLRAGKTYMGGNSDGLPVFQAINLGEMPVAELKAVMAQSGGLFLADEAGTIMVSAGTSTKGVGVIKMGPNGNGAAALLGNAGMAASEIQGKKNE